MGIFVKFPRRRPLRVKVDTRTAIDFSFTSAGTIDATVDPAIITAPIDFTLWQPNQFECDFASLDGTVLFSAAVSISGEPTLGRLRVFAGGAMSEAIQTAGLVVGKFDVVGVDEAGLIHKIRSGFWRATWTVTRSVLLPAA